VSIVLDGVYYDDLIPNWHVTRPQNENYIFLLAAEGQFLYSLNSATVQMNKGEIMFIRDRTNRIGTNGQFPPHRKYSAHFRMDSSAEPSLAKEINRIANTPVKLRRFEYFRQRMATLYRAWRTQTTFREVTSTGIAMELVGAVLDDIRKQNIAPHKWMVVKEMENYILARFREEIKIEQLARHVSRTPNYVSTIFKEVTGQTPIEYVHQMRTTTAQDLLLHTSMNVAEISDYLGYCDPTYFNRMFKKWCGEPPSAMVKRRKQL
jgi:YesN/AraC family two-component response regulator